MAHFAELDLDNIVKRVVVIDNNDLLDGDGVEQESLGVAFCEQLFGGTWVQTSYNGNIRKNYAGVGYTYNSSLDAFIPPQPYASWTLDETTCQWQAPVAMPVDDNFYIWNETDQTWDLVGE